MAASVRQSLLFSCKTFSLMNRMHHLKITIASKSPALPAFKANTSSETLITDEEIPRKYQARPERIRSSSETQLWNREVKKLWDLGPLGAMTLRRRFKDTVQDSMDATTYGYRDLGKYRTISIFSPLLRRWFELRIMNNGGKILIALSFHPVITPTAPVFQMCRAGDKQGLQALFSSGTVSPSVLDDQGRTLLHVSSHETSVRSILNCA